MAVNITFTGNIYDTNGIKFSAAEVSYQVYFRKVNGSSSPSTWSNTRPTILGQYNCNLADGDLLGTAGNAGNNDIVVIVFWRPGIDKDANCSTLIEWGAFEVLLGTGPGMSSSDLYVNDVSISVNIDPNLIWAFPIVGAPHYVDTNYSTTNISNDEHGFTISGTTMYHWYERYGETINDVNQVNNSSYYWGDTSSDLNLPEDANGTHQWSAAGIYDVDLIIEDECGGTTSGTKQIQIYWHPPTCGITMMPSDPDPNEAVFFQFTGTDVDGRVTSIDWTINDGATTTTTSGARDDVIPHSAGLGTDWCGTSASGGAFTNHGNHLVEIVVHYNDGFDDQTLPCDDTFTQNLFTGPTVSFTQDPLLATVSSGVEFTNTSTSTSRVGLGLPDCSEYDWTWTDDGVSTTYSGQPYSYKLSQVPNSAFCEVELCANWSDGWDTQQTCTTESVVFETTVTVTQVDCYYNFNIIGTSSDGTVSGYSWEVYFDTASGTGSWDLIWTSPTGMDQNDKKGGFTSEGYYRVTGYVYGTGATTSDYEDIYVSVVCPDEGLIAVYPIWNGTGVDDVGGDWVHSGYGFESPSAKYSGTNGLDASGLDTDDQIKFTTTVPVDLNNFSLLTFWVKPNSWTDGEQLKITFDDFTHEVNLAHYVNIYSADWQQVFIPLEDLGVATDTVSELIFEATGEMDLYFDDITLSVGDLVYRYLPVCDPDMTASEEGALHVDADIALEDAPSIRTDEDALSIKGYIADPKPRMGSDELIPGLRAYPLPTDIT